MKIRGTGKDFTVTWSMADLVKGNQCRYALLYKVDEVVLSAPQIPEVVSALKERVARDSAAHEKSILETLENVIDCSEMEPLQKEELGEFLRTQSGVLYRLPVVDGDLEGRIDFLMPSDGGWRLQDVTLAKSSKPDAIMQLGHYWNILHSAAPEVLADEVDMILGTGETKSFPVEYYAQMAHDWRETLEKVVAEHIASGNRVDWFDERITRCGTCRYCVAAIEKYDDLLKVASITRNQCTKLQEAGILRMSELAEHDPTQSIEGMSLKSLGKLVRQARFQNERRR